MLPARRNGTGTAGGRRYLSLTLPDWATDCLKRHDRNARRDAGRGGHRRLSTRDRDGKAPVPLSAGRSCSTRSATTPCVSSPSTDGRARPASATARASRMPAPSARRRSPARSITASFTAMFARLADWHANVSPIVAIMDGERPYGDLMLDITGVAHLFGGEAALLDMAVERLAALRLCGARAPSPRASAPPGPSPISRRGRSPRGDARLTSPLRGTICPQGEKESAMRLLAPLSPGGRASLPQRRREWAASLAICDVVVPLLPLPSGIRATRAAAGCSTPSPTARNGAASFAPERRTATSRRCWRHCRSRPCRLEADDGHGPRARWD